MQRGMKPRKLAHEFRNGPGDDPLILLKNGRVKLRMAERSAVESIRWRLVSTEKGAHKAICPTAKWNFVEPFGYEKTTIIPQCLLTRQ